MATNPVKRAWTVEEYLAYEEKTGIKHEYLDGKIYPIMTNHDIIVMNVLAELRRASSKLANSYVYNSDMRIKISDSQYLYADASLIAGTPTFVDLGETTIANPTLVIEVTSAETLGRDIGKKFDAYLHLSSVQAYLLLEQDRPFAQLYTRHEEGWLLHDYKDLEAIVPLESMGCNLALSEVYLNIDFEAGIIKQKAIQIESPFAFLHAESSLGRPNFAACACWDYRGNGG